MNFLVCVADPVACISVARSRRMVAGAVMLAQAINGHGSLATLMLERCGLGDTGLVALAEAVRTVSFLLHSLRRMQGPRVLLMHLSTSNRRVWVLHSHIKQVPSMTLLSLRGNRLSSAAAKVSVRSRTYLVGENSANKKHTNGMALFRRVLSRPIFDVTLRYERASFVFWCSTSRAAHGMLFLRVCSSEQLGSNRR
jgi:hypothetical protein